MHVESGDSQYNISTAVYFNRSDEYCFDEVQKLCAIQKKSFSIFL